MLQHLDFSKTNKYLKAAGQSFSPTFLSDAAKQAARTALDLGIKGNTQFDDKISKTELIAELERLISKGAEQNIGKYLWGKERPQGDAGPGMWNEEVEHELMHIYSKAGYELCLKVTIHMMYHMKVGFIDSIKDIRKKGLLSNIFQKILCCGLPVGNIVELTEFIREEHDDQEGDSEYYACIEKEVATFKKLLNLSKKSKSLSYLMVEHEHLKKMFTKKENEFLTEMLDIIMQAGSLKAPWRQYDETGVMEFIDQNDGWDDRLHEKNLLVLIMGDPSELDSMYDQYTFSYGDNTGAPFLTFKIQTKEDLQQAAQYIGLVRRCAKLFSKGIKLKWTK